MSRWSWLALGVCLMAAPLAAEAQTARMPRIGIIRSIAPPDPFVEAFREGLRDIGYTEGQTIAIEYRWAEGRDERLPGLATELVRLGVDVIVAGRSSRGRTR